MIKRRLIDMSNPPSLTFTPSTVEEEVIQSIYLILNTFKHTAPCYRDYGISPDWLHRPLPAAQQAYSVALQKALMDYEPRVQVHRVRFTVDPLRPDALYPILEVTIRE